jgi:hypothetical protein
MASSSSQPKLEFGQLVYLPVNRDGDILYCEAIVAHNSGGRCILALAGAAALDPGTGATVTSAALAEGEVPGVYESGQGPVWFVSSPCREVLLAPRNANTVDFTPGIGIMSITRLWRRHDLGAEFLGTQGKDNEPEAKSKKPTMAKKAKHAQATFAAAVSSGSQSAAANEDSNGGEELDSELGEAWKEMAGLFQEDGTQAQKQTKKKKMEAILAHVRTDALMEAILTYVRHRRVERDAKTTGKGKSAKEELSGEEERFRKGGRGHGRGRAE